MSFNQTTFAATLKFKKFDTLSPDALKAEEKPACTIHAHTREDVLVSSKDSRLQSYKGF